MGNSIPRWLSEEREEQIMGKDWDAQLGGATSLAKRLMVGEEWRSGVREAGPEEWEAI